MGWVPLGVVQVQILTTTLRNAISTALKQVGGNGGKGRSGSLPKAKSPGSDRARVQFGGLSASVL